MSTPLFMFILVILLVLFGTWHHTKMQAATKDLQKTIHPNYPDVPRKEQMQTYVAGHAHHKASKKLIAGSGLAMYRDPENEYDQNAIELHDSQQRLVGFIPRDEATVLAPMMDKGTKMYAEVKNSYGPPKITVYRILQ